MPTETLLKALSIEKDVVSQSDSGISWTSDRVTYPAELRGQLLPEDVHHRSRTVLEVYKEGALAGLFSRDNIFFTLHGDFRPYEQLIEDDPASIVPPVMADVYVTYDARMTSGVGAKAAMSKVDVHFNALDMVRPPAEDPRIRFVCQGHYEPAGGSLTGDGYVPFEFVIEVDQQARISLAEDRSSVDAVVTDNSPDGVRLTVAD